MLSVFMHHAECRGALKPEIKLHHWAGIEQVLRVSARKDGVIFLCSQTDRSKPVLCRHNDSTGRSY